MRHLHSGRKLGVAPHHRKALLRSLTLALIEKEAIKTTPARAKELRWFADRVVTLAKRGDVAGRRQIVKILGSTQNTKPGVNRVRTAVDRIYTRLVPRFQTRPGGYTQIVRLATRRAGDNAELCVMRYLPEPDEKPTKAAKKDKKEAKPKAEASAATTAAKTKETKPKAKKKEKEG